MQPRIGYPDAHNLESAQQKIPVYDDALFFLPISPTPWLHSLAIVHNLLCIRQETDGAGIGGRICFGISKWKRRPDVKTARPRRRSRIEAGISDSEGLSQSAHCHPDVCFALYKTNLSYCSSD